MTKVLSSADGRKIMLWKDYCNDWHKILQKINSINHKEEILNSKFVELNITFSYQVQVAKCQDSFKQFNYQNVNTNWSRLENYDHTIHIIDLPLQIKAIQVVVKTLML